VIVDAFMFFNELELLEIRLHELTDVVDRFVLVESPVTHSGKPKPLYFAQHRNDQRFAAFLPRIEHVVVELPTGAGHQQSWQRENDQRRAIARGLQRFGPGDVLMVSDADEIPSADGVRCYDRVMGVAALEQMLSYFYVNATGGGWYGTRMVPYERYVQQPDLQVYRTAFDYKIQRGGWHFSYLGGADRVRAKLASFAHTEMDTPEYSSRVEDSLRETRLLWDAAAQCTVVPLDDRFPRHLVENRERFAHLIKEV